MIIKVKNVDVEIENFTEQDYDAVNRQLESDLSGTIKNREAIQNAFSLALQLSPNANPSDIWHHVVYRLYKDKIVRLKDIDDAINSWVRASGDAFEYFYASYYNNVLKKTDIRLLAQTKKHKIEVLKLMGIYGKVGDSKLDIAVAHGCVGNECPSLEVGLFGGIHMKASLAERVSDDVPCSAAMMAKGYLSILATLDVKSFPKSSTMSALRAYRNNGELGSPDSPTDKRLYIEGHGSFDACMSHNLRTIPSPDKTTSGKKIFVSKFDGKWDALCELLDMHSKKVKAERKQV